MLSSQSLNEMASWHPSVFGDWIGLPVKQTQHVVSMLVSRRLMALHETAGSRYVAPQREPTWQGV